MASVQLIESILEHRNADALELATILGYTCVIKKNQEFKMGDRIIFIEPDYVLPNNIQQFPWVEPFLPYAQSRIRAIRLRGVYSEGLVVKSIDGIDLEALEIGSNINDLIGVTKYTSRTKGPNYLNMKHNCLPYNLPKTDEERWQRIKYKLPFGQLCTVTLKIDGQSASYGFNQKDEKVSEKTDINVLSDSDGKGTFFATSRSLDLKLEDVNPYTAHIKRYGIDTKLQAYCEEHKVSLVLRGESYGPGIQVSKVNPHCRVKTPSWALFSVYDLHKKHYCDRGTPHFFLNVAKAIGLPHVPILEEDVILTQELIDKYCEKMDKLPDGSMFEGVVIQHAGGSFKIINKKY